MAGRGWGKTRVGAEDMAWYGRTHPGAEMAIIGRTDASVRRVCIEGPSGLLKSLDRSEVDEYNRSAGFSYVRLDNGSVFYIASAASPDGLLGLNLSRAWCDELASWTKPETWTQALIPAMRDPLATPPQIIVTTTPRPVGLVKDLVKQPSTIITRGSTWENADHLSPEALEELKRQYEGTRLGRQELEGELLDDVPGALWTLSLIDSLRIDEAPDMSRVVVAIDPAGGTQEHNDETGIVVCGRDFTGHGYVLADRSLKASPTEWAQTAIAAYDEFKADRIVAEQNYGHDMVESTIRAVRRGVPVKMVNASRGKRVRAEPISALYEKQRVHHVARGMERLEDQMCRWIPDEKNGKSPDRVDALVWALTALHLIGDLSAVLFDPTTVPAALDGSELMKLNGAFAMAEADRRPFI